jgi:hypothetical protein
MLGQLNKKNHLFFNSPQGTGERLEVPEPDGRKLTLRDMIAAWEAERRFTHTLEQYHFSINAREVSNMDLPLNYVSGDMLVATLAKVGGSD